MKAGALDYLVKSEAILADTPHIAERALREWRHITERKRMDEALRESEERFRRVFEESPIGISLMDEDLRIIEANNAFCQMLGYTEEELIGATLVDVTLPEDVEASEELLNKTLSGEIPGFRLEKR